MANQQFDIKCIQLDQAGLCASDADKSYYYASLDGVQSNIGAATANRGPTFFGSVAVGAVENFFSTLDILGDPATATEWTVNVSGLYKIELIQDVRLSITTNSGGSETARVALTPRIDGVLVQAPSRSSVAVTHRSEGGAPFDTAQNELTQVMTYVAQLTAGQTVDIQYVSSLSAVGFIIVLGRSIQFTRLS
jgi:hypothetical protein